MVGRKRVLRPHRTVAFNGRESVCALEGRSCCARLWGWREGLTNFRKSGLHHPEQDCAFGLLRERDGLIKGFAHSVARHQIGDIYLIFGNSKRGDLAGLRNTINETYRRPYDGMIDYVDHVGAAIIHVLTDEAVSVVTIVSSGSWCVESNSFRYEI